MVTSRERGASANRRDPLPTTTRLARGSQSSTPVLDASDSSLEPSSSSCPASGGATALVRTSWSLWLTCRFGWRPRIWSWCWVPPRAQSPRLLNIIGAVVHRARDASSTADGGSVRIRTGSRRGYGWRSARPRSRSGCRRSSHARTQRPNRRIKMPDTTTMICPKCHGEMRTYERNGVLVDQCDECRGIFLDRGELEQLLDRAARPRAARRARRAST